MPKTKITVTQEEKQAMIERLDVVRRDQRISSYMQMSTDMGMSVSYVQQYITGHNTIGVSFARKLEQKYGVNPNWLLRGVPPMYVSSGVISDTEFYQRLQSLLEAYPEVKEALKIQIDEMTDEEWMLLRSICRKKVENNKIEEANASSDGL